MSQPTFILVAGITGVFSGMALLYIAIKIMGTIAAKIESGKKEKKNE